MLVGNYKSYTRLKRMRITVDNHGLIFGRRERKKNLYTVINPVFKQITFKILTFLLHIC